MGFANGMGGIGVCKGVPGELGFAKVFVKRFNRNWGLQRGSRGIGFYKGRNWGLQRS